VRYPDPRNPLDYLRVLALLPWWFFPVVALMIGGAFLADRWLG
jgi:paraquat-inducible protein B